MDEYEEDCDEETIVFEYVPLAFSWRTLTHNTLTHAGGVLRIGAEWLDSVAGQFGNANAQWRESKAKAESKDEARRLLAELDEL